MLQDIISEQEHMLHKITNDHEEFLSKSSSQYSLTSDLNDANMTIALNVYKILKLPYPQKQEIPVESKAIDRKKLPIADLVILESSNEDEDSFAMPRNSEDFLSRRKSTLTGGRFNFNNDQAIKKLNEELQMLETKTPVIPAVAVEEPSIAPSALKLLQKAFLDHERS